jgi:hypothetical protein
MILSKYNNIKKRAATACHCVLMGCSHVMAWCYGVFQLPVCMVGSPLAPGDDVRRCTKQQPGIAK